MSLILTSDDEQKAIAESSKAQIESRGRRILTEIKPLEGFYLAEDYHQKYYLTRVPVLLKEMRNRHGSFKEFVDSFEVARINGYVGGYGTIAMLEKELDRLGLSAEAEHRLRDIVSTH